MNDINKYKVICDETNNSKEDIDNGILNIDYSMYNKPYIFNFIDYMFNKIDLSVTTDLSYYQKIKFLESYYNKSFSLIIKENICNIIANELNNIQPELSNVKIWENNK